MSRCSKKCNEIKAKIDSISGLDDDFVYETLCKIENLLDSLDEYADLEMLNGTCFKDRQINFNKLYHIEKKNDIIKLERND